MTAQVIRIGIDARGARAGGAAVRNELGGIKREARGLQGQLVTTGRSIVNVRNLLMSFITAAGIGQAIKMADTYKLINARLLNVSDSAKEATRGYQRLLLMSNRTRSSIEGSAALYTKLILSGKQFGVTQQRALTITENVNKALRISGASAIEAAAAQLQLSQAIASGTLQGDEFRSVMENAPRLARALVDALKLKGGIGELRQLSKQGKLTIDQLVRALTDAKISEKLEAEFKNIPLTVGQAFTVLKNQVQDAIGSFDRMNYVTAGLSKAIVFLAGNLNRIIMLGFPLMVAWLLKASGTTMAVARAFSLLGAAAVGTGGKLAVLGRFARIYGTGAAVAAASTRGLSLAVRTLGNVLTNLNVILTVIVTVLALLAMKKDLAAQAADRMNDREGRLAQVIDYTTGKIKTQNAALVTNIRLKAMADMQKAQAGLTAAQRAGLEAAGAQDRTYTTSATPFGAIANPIFQGLFGRRSSLAGSPIGKELETLFKGGKVLGGSQGLISRMQELVDKGKMTKDTFEDATKAIGDFYLNVQDLNQANAELRLLSGKGSQADKELLGVGIPQPGITSPDLGKKTKNAKSKADELNARLEKAQANANKLADIMGTWDAEPKLIDKANKDKRALDEMVGEWIEVNGQVVKYTQAMADIGKQKIDTGLTRQLNDDLEAGRDQLLIMGLQLKGQYALAEAVRRTLDYKRQGIPVDEEKYRQILRQTAAEEQLSKELEKQQRMLDIYRGAVGEIQGAFEELLLNFKPGNFIKSIAQSFKQLQVRIISEKIFGPIMQQVEDMVTGKTGVRAANDFLAQQATQSGNSLGGFEDAIVNTTNLLAQVNSRLQKIAAGEVPDPFAFGADASGGTVNGGELVVTGQRLPRGGPMSEFGPGDLMQVIFGGVARPIISVLEKLGIKLPKNFSKEFGALLGDAVFGAQIGPAIAQSLGFLKNGGGVGAQVGGAIGGVLGKLGGAAVGKAIGGIAGQLGGPLGSIIGSVAGSLLGNVVGKLFGGGQTKRSSVVINNVDQKLVATGNNKEYKAAAVQAGGAIQDALSRIADQFGASTGSFNIAIGRYDGDWRVNVNGQGGRSLRAGTPGTFDFNQDGEGAIRFAVLEAIKQGAIEGLRAGTQKLLQSAKDLDSGLEKAFKFEQFFKDYVKATNPIQGAVDELNRKFKDLQKIFKEAGATTEEWGQLEEMYNIERKKMLEEQIDRVNDFLKDLLGDKSFKTAYDRLQEADVAFRAFEEQIAAGQQVNQDAFVEAGQRLQELAREVYGSTPDFFSYQQRLIDATQGTIDIIQAIADSQDNILVIRDAITTGNDAITDGIQDGNEILRNILDALRSGGGFAGAFNLSRY